MQVQTAKHNRDLSALQEPKPAYRLSNSLKINVSAERVWALLSDFHGLQTWAERVTDLYAIGQLSNGLGAARRCHVRGLGAIDEIVTVWGEGQQLGYRVSPVGPLGVAHSLWRIEAIGQDACKVTLTLRYDLKFGSIGKLLHFLVLKRLLQANIDRVMTILKTHLESSTD